VPNKAQFVEMLAERLDGDRKRAAAALDAVIDTVYAAIARGEKVAITGFGVFERRDRRPRIGRNPATGARVDVPASRVPAFRPGTEFRAIANGARGLLEERAARAQSAVNRATAAVRSTADTMREAPGRAAAAAKQAGKKAPAKKAAKKTTAKKTAAKKATKSPTKKATKKSAPAKKATAKKTAAKKSTTKKAPAKKATKKAPAKRK
jgi:Bacterial nucleoid DNA-binding protein